MDLDELQSVQSRERQTDSLQQLRATFYQDTADYIQRLEDERDRAAERADDPWNAPEVGRLNDDIDTASQTVEAIYERRVGKIVKMASLAAADMPTDDEGLTEEEQSLFETLVAAIENNRDSVFAILDGESPVENVGSESTSRSTGDASPASTGDASPASTGDPRQDATGKASANDRAAHPDPEDLRVGEADPEPTSDRDGESGGGQRPAPESDEPTSDMDATIDAVDIMGDGPESGGGAPDSPANAGAASESTATDPSSEPDTEDGRGHRDVTPGNDRSAPDGGTRTVDTGPDATDARSTPGSGASASTPADSGEPDRRADGASVDRSTVKITNDVGEIFGVDERSYDLTADDVVVLPEANANPLVDRGAAERLD